MDVIVDRAILVGLVAVLFLVVFGKYFVRRLPWRLRQWLGL